MTAENRPEGLIDPVLARIARELGGPAPAWPPRGDLEALAGACGGDERRLKRWIKRRLAGEAVAHIIGWFEFRGLRLAIDKRAYVTDPELTHLVDAVLARARTLAAPLVADIGAGCGSLALAVKRALPAARVIGLDLDPDALALARRNAADLRLELTWVESDLFEDWPAELGPPDLVFGDPPWGDESTLYGPDRAAGHYRAMPPSAAFPLGGRAAAHGQILRALQERGWASEAWLNGGVLPPEELAAAVPAGADWEIVSPAPGLSLLRCRFPPSK